MKPEDRAGYLAHSKGRRFALMMQTATGTIADMLNRCRNPYVAFSGGKDSSCLLWLVLQQAPDISARILTSGETRLLHSNMDDVMAWWQAGFPGLDLQELLIDRVFTAEWAEATWAEQRKAGRGDLANMLPASGEFDGVFLGLRDEESNARRMANRAGAIRRYAGTRRDGAAGMWCCCPLSRWRLADVGALVCRETLPMLAAYDAEGLETRTTARLTGDAARQNAVLHLRQRDPAAYNRLLQRFPELTWWAG